MPNPEIPLDALGYLGGLFEARFYQPHSTTDDPRDEIREAAALFGVDLAMMMSIAKVESASILAQEPDHTKGSFNLATTSSRSTVTAASGTRGTTLVQLPTCFWSKQRSQMGAWSLSRLRREIHGASAGYPRRD